MNELKDEIKMQRIGLKEFFFFNLAPKNIINRTSKLTKTARNKIGNQLLTQKKTGLR